MKLPTKLETQNLILRPYQALDWENFLQFMLCTQVTNYLNFTPEQTTMMGAKALLETTLNSYNSSSPLFALVIAQQKNNLFIYWVLWVFPSRQTTKL